MFRRTKFFDEILSDKISRRLRLNILGLGMMIHLARNAKNHHFDPPPHPPS